jgi:GT2 family glycosyltransferase
MKAKVAIVILNWNGESYLRKFLPFVVKNSDKPEYKVIIADNNSTDGSIGYVKMTFPHVEIITFKSNLGYAKGYALALPQIDSEYYVLLNSDVEVSPGWIEPLVTLLDGDSSIAAAMPKILSYSRRDYFEYAGAAGGFIDKFGYPFCQGRILAEVEKDRDQYNTLKEIFWASGACMFLRSSAYSQTGGLDGDFFAHMEEIDLCWRLKRLGYKIYYCPDSIVYHLGGGTLPNNNPRKLYYNYRNNLYLLFKNINGTKFLTIFLPRIFMDFLSAFIYLLQGRILFFLSVIRAYLRFIVNLKMLINKRLIFNKIIAKIEVEQVYNGSIVYAFFIKGVRSFTELKF